MQSKLFGIATASQPMPCNIRGFIGDPTPTGNHTMMIPESHHDELRIQSKPNSTNKLKCTIRVLRPNSNGVN